MSLTARLLFSATKHGGFVKLKLPECVHTQVEIFLTVNGWDGWSGGKAHSKVFGPI